MQDNFDQNTQNLNKSASPWQKLAFVVLLLILALGAYLRFTGLDWDSTYHLHPDERFLTMVANALQPTDPLTYLRTSESTLNPYNRGHGNYVYGNLPMTLTRLVAEGTTQLCQLREAGCAHTYNSYDGVHLVGRFLSGFVDLISISLIFLIGRRLYDWRIGLLAALFLSIAVMPIQQSHFFTTDNWAAMWVTFTIYTAVRASENVRRWHWWVLFGIGLGLAAASRINVAPVAGISVVAGWVWLARQAKDAGISYLATDSGWINLQRVILGVLLAAVISIFTFRVAQPYAFMDSQLVRQTILVKEGREANPLEVAVLSLVGFNPQWLDNMSNIQQLQSPEASFPPALQWTNRKPLLFPFTNMVLYGMGISAGLAAWLGFCLALWHILRAYPDWTKHLIPLSWGAFYFIFIGTRWVKSIRYFLPIYPVLLLLGAWLLIHWWDKSKDSIGKRALAGLALTVAVLPSLLWANAFVKIYQEPVTRVSASAWMLDNIPSGATLFYEADGVPHQIQLPLKGYEFYNGNLPMQLNFQIPTNGTLQSVRMNYLSDPDGGNDKEKLEVMIIRRDLPESLAQGAVLMELGETKQAVTVDLPPIPLEAEQNYTVVLQKGEGGGFVAGTSVIANETWDDALPVRYEGRDPFSQYFRGVTGGDVPITNPGNPDKLQAMLAWLDEADVIVLSSQRSLWNTPRLPLTYPLNLRYYEALFNGEMGFELAAQFHADLQVGDLYISDTAGKMSWGQPPELGWPPPNEYAAEEAFSVYDHPPVWIFVKTDAYSATNAQTILSAVDLSQQVFMTPGTATQAPTGLMLSVDTAIQQQTNGTFSDIFAVDGLLSQSPTFASIVWWLAIILLGWFTFPLTYTVFRGLADRGYVLSRILSLLLISYFGWILASFDILPNTANTLWFGALLITCISLISFVYQRKQIITFVQDNLTYLMVVEALGIALYLLFIIIRLGNPDMWDVIWGGEKPMDLAYFNAVLKSTTFPPYDPWYAGGYINYYYYGFVYVGSLTKMLGVVPTLAYNLILPMLFSFTGLGAFTLAYNLVVAIKPSLQKGIQTLHRQAVVAGITALTLCVLLGNLGEIGVVFHAWERSSDTTFTSSSEALTTLVHVMDGGLDLLLSDRPAAINPGDWFWTATRAINTSEGEVQPITEFPLFTFLYSDLHAHMIAMPLMFLALGWAISLALQAPQQRKFIYLWQWLVGGLSIGVLQATNTWDLPTYLVIGSLAIIFAVCRHYQALNLRLFGSIFLGVLALISIALLSFAPFSASYGTGYSSVSLWSGSYTHVTNYLTIYGLFLFLIMTHLIWESHAWIQTWTTERVEAFAPYGIWLIIPLGGFILLLFALFWRDYWIAPIALTLVVWSGLLSLRPQLPAGRRIILVLISSAIALTLAVEIIVLDGDIGRMNTVFKFYMQVWLILSVVGGVAFALAWSKLKEQQGLTYSLWRIVLIVLLCLAGLYPILATKAKWEIRMSDEAPTTLDGIAFMPVTEYQDSGQVVPLAYDYEAIQWMYRNIEGSPVIAEAHSGNPYRSISNRVSMYTGLPAIVGWDWHQRQQRAIMPDSLVRNRILDVTHLYNTTNVDDALTIIEKYNVQYVYVGQLEWIYYVPEGLLKFEQMVTNGLLEEVYRNDGTSIYKVRTDVSS